MSIDVFNEVFLSPDISVEGNQGPHTSVSPIVISDGVVPCIAINSQC